jgi:hypothetical protein
MRIRNARRSHMDASSRGFRTLGRFALEVADGILIFDCRLVLSPDGTGLVYGPTSKGGAQVLSLSKEIREEIITLAAKAMELDSEIKRAA